MKIRIFFFVLFGYFSLMCLNAQNEAGENYLRKVLVNLEKIESVTYYLDTKVYLPGDTVPRLSKDFVKDYNYPADTIVGAQYVRFDGQDTTKLTGGYNGEVRLWVSSQKKDVYIDDFTSRSLPLSEW